MSEQNSCEFCSNYVYDEEYEEYGCVVNMDEDDLARLLQFKNSSCPYFSYGDEYRIVRKYPHGESIVKYANNIITGVVYMAYFVILIFLAVNRDERVIRIVLVTGISFILVSIFRYVVDAPRPYTLYEFKPVVKKEKTGQSMPSRHVFSAFVIGMSALYISVHLGILILADSFLMCFMRVIAGVHFPKDVIVGAIIGILSGVIGFYII